MAPNSSVQELTKVGKKVFLTNSELMEVIIETTHIAISTISPNVSELVFYVSWWSNSFTSKCKKYKITVHQILKSDTLANQFRFSFRASCPSPSPLLCCCCRHLFGYHEKQFAACGRYQITGIMSPSNVFRPETLSLRYQQFEFAKCMMIGDKQEL